ncbi:site-specific integrase [uncultured Desulfosarcina sp.]|uniref:site-specific integrase n=1 Tax=uncultured Desulfosarcina sp. TaxID=218289 RepID=UPI0029C89EB1|nr:site-specific integrase [uncultured Desulfosarcina sp.]
MKLNNIIDLARHRETSVKPKDRIRSKSRKKGSVYVRSGKLWVDFRYLGQRAREPSGLEDTSFNRKKVRKQLDLVIAEIENGVFEYAKRFPHSNKKDNFSVLEGRAFTKGPSDITFGEYAKKWWQAMEPGMSQSKIRDYTDILNGHALPYFEKMPFSEITSVEMKKFIAHLQAKRNRLGKPLSAKRIRNIMIPIRVIVRDAVDEHVWAAFHDPFGNLKLPRVAKFRVRPFTTKKWELLLKHLPPWYRPYFDFAVLTGLRPSEQVALKWSALDGDFLHVELSRVAGLEKTDLKTEESQRIIELRPSMKRVLEHQHKATADFGSDYVFVNTEGNPMNRFTLYTHWEKAIKKSSLTHRRMYETRHTFASWALAAGESPEWVARTLGHVDTSMVYRTYGRYIPNLTRQDGSALENLYAGSH